MDSNEYKRIIKEENVLDFGTLKVTMENLDKAGLKRIYSEIERIIKENKIEKPDLHESPNTQETDYYKIDIDSDDIESIVDMFSELEVSAVYDGRSRAAWYYTNMLDKWNDLPDYK